MEAKKQSTKTIVKTKQPEGRLRCVVTWQGQRVRLSVSHNVNPNYWESALQRCRAKSVHGINKTPASTINRAIDDLENLVDGIFRSFEAADAVPTKAQFTEEYGRLANNLSRPEGDISEIADHSLFKIYDEFIKDGINSGRWSNGTLVKTRTIRKHLKSISPKLSLEELIDGGVNSLISYFSNIPDNLKNKGLANTTIKNDIAFVKVFLRWAQEHGHCDATSFLSQRVKLKTAEKPVVFLTWNELMKVYNFDFGGKKYLTHVRDVFCFCCFTSLRFSDVYNLRRSNISETAINITTIKTHDTLTIELNKYSKAILKKYEGIVFPNDKALPVITNQKMNNYLKELGKICGIDDPITITQYKGTQRVDATYKKYELLSTHCGRRTFVCNAIMLGIPANIVMQWTGHSDYATMRPYIAIADKARKSAMTIFDKIDNDGNIPHEDMGQKVGQ